MEEGKMNDGTRKIKGSATFDIIFGENGDISTISGVNIDPITMERIKNPTSDTESDITIESLKAGLINIFELIQTHISKRKLGFLMK
jgi:hypothetical protein